MAERLRICADCGEQVYGASGHIHGRFSPTREIEVVRLPDHEAVEAERDQALEQVENARAVCRDLADRIDKKAAELSDYDLGRMAAYKYAASRLLEQDKGPKGPHPEQCACIVCNENRSRAEGS